MTERRRRSCGVLLLLLSALAGCQTQKKTTSAVPSIALDAQDRAPDRPIIPNLDPGAMRLQDISGALLMYFALHRKLPDQLTELTPLADVDAPLNFISPRTNTPYIYTRNGIFLQDQKKRMVVYESAPGPNGFREAITIDNPIVGQPLVAKVIAVPESFFLLHPPK